MSDLISEILGHSETFGEEWSALMNEATELRGPNDEMLDLDRVIPGTVHSMRSLDERVIGFVGILVALEEVESTSLIPDEYLANLSSSLRTLSENSETLSNSLAGFTDHGGTGQLDPDNFTVINPGGDYQVSFAADLQRVSTELNTALACFHNISVIVKAPDYAGFTSAFKQFSGLLRQVRDQNQELSSLQKTARGNNTRIETFTTESKQNSVEISNLKDSATQANAAIETNKTNADTHLSAINTILESAQELYDSVTEYQDDFQKFQRSLDDRNDTYNNLIKDLNSLVERAKKHNTNVGEITTRASGMLAGATNAGLAGTFKTIMDTLSRQLLWARIGFYFSISLLFTSALPLFFYVTPGFLEIFGIQVFRFSNTASPIELEIGQAFVRALLLLPTAWLTKFAAARHAALFRLRENYSYKYSIAMSVDGFKKQAQGYKEEIAAASFFELAYNPADKMHGKTTEHKHPNRAMDWLMNKFGLNEEGKAS